MSTHTYAPSATGALFGTFLSDEAVPTGPHSDGPVGVHAMTNDAHGWRSALRRAVADYVGVKPGQVRLVADFAAMNLDGVLVRHAYYLPGRPLSQRVEG